MTAMFMIVGVAEALVGGLTLAEPPWSSLNPTPPTAKVPKMLSQAMLSQWPPRPRWVLKCAEPIPLGGDRDDAASGPPIPFKKMFLGAGDISKVG